MNDAISGGDSADKEQNKKKKMLSKAKQNGNIGMGYWIALDLLCCGMGTQGLQS
jgi:hypothetical protein